MSEEIELNFPPNFFWGCSTSAHQIEGGLTNDWSEWEKSPARILDLQKKNLHPADFVSGQAANSYLEANEDIACLKSLGVNSYRFSVDWSRIEPEEGKYDQAALTYYLNFVKKLRAHHIEPFVTLWHWPLPLWLRDKGGWASKKIILHFDGFVRTVVTHLGAEVKFWLTLNEPMVYSTMSYLTGEWPPQKNNFVTYFRVVEHLIAAHCRAYDTIKAVNPSNQVGIAKHNIYFEAFQKKLVNRMLKFGADWWWNERFLNKIAQKQDFIGLNYYFHNKIDWGFAKAHAYEKISDLDWGLHPEGILEVLQDLKKYNKPIYITENGLADKGDQHRSWYIRKILQATHEAIARGVPVKGYFHWSLLDNFEWAHGFQPRFGLYEVDYQTFARTPRASAKYYEDICRNNRVV